MPPQALGAYNAVKQALSLFSPFNKSSSGPDESESFDTIAEYRTDLPDEKIIELKNKWKRDYAQYYSEIEPKQKKNYDYWIGTQTKQTVEDMLNAGRSLVDNEIFVSFETFLPLATRTDAQCVVTIDQSIGDQTLATLIRDSLHYQADRQRLHLLLRAQTRDWGLFRIGVLKIGWDSVLNDVKTDVINPKRIILDPDGHVDTGGNFTGDYIGERKMVDADTLATMFPKSAQYITRKVSGKMGTKLTIEEWWYKRKDYFFTLDDHVLGKFKNHLWNYDGKDENGDEIVGKNHLEQPCDPYIFLVVYNTRTQPHDDTTSLEQAISIQDLVNRRFRQIDTNAESTNNGIVVNGNLNSEQASLAAEAVRKGGAIRIPDKSVDVRTAVMRLPAPPLADTVVENIQDGRALIGRLFGISGSTPQSINNEESVRGKILINQLDSSRIGGSITENIEQVADTWYNKTLQVMYVYYDTPHYAAAIGPTGANQLIQLKNTDFRGKILVTVKAGSMVPKDPLTLRNQAIDLWNANGIDPISLGKYLEMPDPYEYAKSLMTWQLIQKGSLPPTVMFPDIQPAQQQQGTTQGSVMPPSNGVENVQSPLGSSNAVSLGSKQLLDSVPINK